MPPARASGSRRTARFVARRGKRRGSTPSCSSHPSPINRFVACPTGTNAPPPIGRRSVRRRSAVRKNRTFFLYNQIVCRTQKEEKKKSFALCCAPHLCG